MLALDGAHVPLRPEPSPRSGKRGKGNWKESKGFRFYFVDSERIIHLISWHQVQSDKELVNALQAIKDADFFIACMSKTSVAKRGYVQILATSEDLDQLRKKMRYLKLIMNEDRNVLRKIADEQMKYNRELSSIKGKLAVIDEMEKKQNKQTALINAPCLPQQNHSS